MTEQTFPRGWYRDESGITHEMTGTVDPITGSVSFPHPPCGAFYSVLIPALDDTPYRDLYTRPMPPPESALPDDQPKTFQDLLDDFGQASYMQGRNGGMDYEAIDQAEQALIAHETALVTEIARLKDGLTEIVEALKELESL